MFIYYVHYRRILPGRHCISIYGIYWCGYSWLTSLTYWAVVCLCFYLFSNSSWMKEWDCRGSWTSSMHCHSNTHGLHVCASIAAGSWHVWRHKCVCMYVYVPHSSSLFKFLSILPHFKTCVPVLFAMQYFLLGHLLHCIIIPAHFLLKVV